MRVPVAPRWAVTSAASTAQPMLVTTARCATTGPATPRAAAVIVVAPTSAMNASSMRVKLVNDAVG